MKDIPLRLCTTLICISAVFVACNGGTDTGPLDPPKPSPTAKATESPSSPTTGTQASSDEPSTYSALVPPGAVRGKVRIAWTVESTEGIYGFNVYRQMRNVKGWERVNDKPILAADGGTSTVPHDYEIIDTHKSLFVGVEYFYWLEAVHTDGTKQRAWWPPKRVLATTKLDEEFPPQPGSK